MSDRPSPQPLPWDEKKLSGKSSASPSPRSNVRREILVIVGLAALVLAAHSGSLWDGVYYDDHWQRAMFRRPGWGWNDLINAATFDFPGRLLHMWWQEQPLQWRFPRPVAMFFMKLAYVLAGGDSFWIHACGLIWHWLNAILVYRLARWALGVHSQTPSPCPLPQGGTGISGGTLGVTGWAVFAAALFVLNPNATFALSWSAAHNAVVGTFFLLAALLAYVAASFQRDRQPGVLRWGALSASIALWWLALFSRETAVIFPVLVIALDGFFGGARHLRRRLPVHALLVLLTLAYFAWRLLVFPRASLPVVYFHAPAGVGYLFWAVSKLLQLIFALTLYMPLFILIDPLEAAPRDVIIGHAIMLALLLPGQVMYARVTRGVRGRWYWPLWLVLAFAPVVPVVTMPHFGYLPFVGCGIGVALFGMRLQSRWRKVLVSFTLCAIVAALCLHRIMWRGGFRSEQLIYADVCYTTPPPPPGSKLFFINLPTTATFATVALREQWGVEDLEGYVLTFAPEAFRMKRPSTVERLNDHELLVTTPAPGYFGGYDERVLLRMSRPGAPLVVGQTVPGELFDTTIMETEGVGITKLRFTFHESLDANPYYFYVSTPERPAYRLRFDQEFDAQALAQETERWRAANRAALADRERLVRLIDFFAK